MSFTLDHIWCFWCVPRTSTLLKSHMVHTVVLAISELSFQVHRKADVVNCALFQIFQTSYFENDKNEVNKTNDSYSPLNITPSPDVENVNNIFCDLRDVRKKYTKHFLICHLNNRMRYYLSS